MTIQLFILLLLALVVAVYIGLAAAAFFRMRGKRVVICPETKAPAGVTVDAAHAALSAIWEKPEIRLETCTRWPGREGCDQACAAQIAVAPEETLAASILIRWYAGKTCAICRTQIPPVHPMEPKPGLLDVDSRQTMSWEDIPADRLPEMLESYLPVCASCHVSETFRRQFPEMVVDRAETEKRDALIH